MTTPPPQLPWWHREGVIGWLLLLLPPLGLVLMWRHAPWRKVFKWTLTLVVPFVWLVVVVGVFGEEPSQEQASAEVSSAPTATSLAATTSPILTSTAAPTTSANIATAAATARGSPQATQTAPTGSTLTPTPQVETASTEEQAREASAPTDGTPGAVTPPTVSGTAGRLTVYFFDVSLGDAVYIRTPTGEDVLIDGGDSAHEVSAFLDALGETRIDVVVPSHAHADHVRGLVRVMKERQVGAVWMNGEEYTTQVWRDLNAAVDASGAVKTIGRPGDRFSLGQVTFTVLAPLSLGSNPNNNSLVLRMDCGSSSFMFTGDAELEEERLMVASRTDLDIDVLKMGHHGSRTSTSSMLLTATTPRLAVYQARVGNQYGHPHQEALERLSNANVPVTGTGSAGGTVVVETECDDQFAVSHPVAGFAIMASSPVPPPQTTAVNGLAPAPPATAQATAVPAPRPVPGPTATTAGSICDTFTSQKVRDWCRAPAGNVLNCADFPTRTEATRFTQTVDAFDVNALDGDNDGTSCDSLPP